MERISEAKVVRQAEQQWLKEEGVFDWLLQEKAVSSFPSFYYSDVSCYIIDGQVTLTVSGDDELQLQAGDFITLPKGVACYWELIQPLRAHVSSKDVLS